MSGQSQCISFMPDGLVSVVDNAWAIDCGNRHSTLHRWIQIQANLQRLSESPISTKRLNGNGLKAKERKARKRMREPEEDAKSDDEHETQERLVSPSSPGLESSLRSTKASTKTNFKTPEESVSYSILLDWENEGPYDEAVKG